jgi:hypothetical protein
VGVIGGLSAAVGPTVGIVIWSGPNAPDVRVLLVLGGGVVAGLFLLVKGFGGYRAAGRVTGIAPSRIASIAAGEVLVTGTAEPIELTLVSPLQSAPCLYYRSRVMRTSNDTSDEVFREERAVGFRVRDETGGVRIFPFGAHFDVPDCYDESSGGWSGGPIGLQPRMGSAFGPGPDRESQIAALLTVHDRDASWLGGGTGYTLQLGSGDRHFTEARIGTGDVVTVIGRVVPFGDLADPAAANLLDTSMVGANDPEVAADLAEARAAGLLEDTPAEAWGNAAIEGFGIGRPVRPPELDPAATPPPPADPALEQQAKAAFDIPPDSLVLASAADAPLLVSLGAPPAIAAREQGRFVLGLLGAVVAIGSAMTLAILLGGGLR